MQSSGNISLIKISNFLISIDRKIKLLKDEFQSYYDKTRQNY